jgi:hypothetical protein
MACLGGCFRLSPGQSGDKRDDISAYVLRIGARPLQRPSTALRSGRDDNSFAGDGLRPVSGGVVFSKLSKLLNQENALSAPC